jgi:DNA (cytosine-5)-methyltransferase 1
MMSKKSSARNVAMSSRPKPTVISLFAGCGGSSLGYQMAGYSELLAVEWDDNAVETFKLNFPDVPVYHGDICKLSVDEVLKTTGLKSGELDILDGSPPCQGFSTAGKRVVQDSRNQLFREYIRLLRGLKPKVFVMENVSGMVKGKMKLIFAEIMRELKASGYKVSCRLMNTKYYGVPQSRQRVIFIGVREDLEIKPSHPKPQTEPIPSKTAIENIKDTGFKLTPEADKYWLRLKPGESAAKYHPKGHLFGLIKLNPNKPSPTLTRSSGASKLVHWQERRAIGNKERAALQSFPEDFIWEGTAANIYDRIGNSVPPLFMKAIAKHIKENILEGQVSENGKTEESN